jgi:hypothetical protein
MAMTEFYLVFTGTIQISFKAIVKSVFMKAAYRFDDGHYLNSDYFATLHDWDDDSYVSSEGCNLNSSLIIECYDWFLWRISTL